MNQLLARWHEWRYQRMMRKYNRMVEREVRWLQDLERRVFGDPVQ